MILIALGANLPGPAGPPVSSGLLVARRQLTAFAEDPWAKKYPSIVPSWERNWEQVIPFFNLDREQFLEYDLTKLIYSLSQPNQPKVGLISTLPVTRSCTGWLIPRWP